jgi:hypothetical protein
MVNGRDASDIPFEIASNENIEGAVITLTDRGAEVSGRFVDAAGKPAPGYVLVVFSADRRFWAPRSLRTQVVRPDVNGTYVARDLPAGDYLISVVTDLEDGQWNDPAFLATLAAASPVRMTLAEGDKKVQDIRIGGSYVTLTDGVVASKTLLSPRDSDYEKPTSVLSAARLGTRLGTCYCQPKK